MDQSATPGSDSTNTHGASASPAWRVSGASQDAGTLAHLLEPALRHACDDRLSNVQWFRSAWQAGGASTGFATFTNTDGREVGAVVKLPVGPTEYHWTTGLARNGACTPRVLASGTEIGGHDLAWLVIEKLSGAPLGSKMDPASVNDLLRAAAEFYCAASKTRDIREVQTPPHDWAGLIAKGRDVIHKHGIDQEQRWNHAIKHVQRILPDLVKRWDARPTNTWCHGDLHAGNAMRRAGDKPGDGCVLIDLALVHRGHWIEDAIYLERLYWAKPELLHGIKPASVIAKHLRERGQTDGEDYAMLANMRRVLMAASVPAFMLHEGHPKYVHAALEMLERTLPMLGY